MTRSIVIVGAGIIGSCSAYYLTRHAKYNPKECTITIIEASVDGPAVGASGKAGGLVARWAYPKELVQVSFEEHVKLAEEHNGTDRWGWRYVNVGSWEGRVDQAIPSNAGKSLEKTHGLDQASRKSKGLPDDLNWVRTSQTDAYATMAPYGRTAQVHPYLFTTRILELAKENGVVYLQGKVTAIQKSGGKVTGVSYVDGNGKVGEVRATEVIVSAGAWSPSLVRDLPISTTRAHSITIRPQPGVSIAPYVLFTELGRKASPEIYARPDGEIYCCGPGDEEPLPETVDGVVVDEDACDVIRVHAQSISDEMREGKVEKRQACYLPLGGPIVGPASRVAKGLYIATGHTCWGISNAPGTGKIISELVWDVKITCGKGLNKLDPSRYF